MSEAKSEAQAKPDEEQKINLCRCITSVVASVLIFVIQLMTLILAILNSSIPLGIVSSVILLVVIFTFVAFCGSYKAWNALLNVNKICLFAISVIFAGSMACFATIIGTLNRMPMHSADETRDRDKYIGLLVLFIILFVIQYVLFLLMYIPLFYMYEARKEDKNADESTSLKTATEGNNNK